MTSVLTWFYSIITAAATWFMTVEVENGLALGEIMIAVILSGLAATYVVMAARFRNEKN